MIPFIGSAALPSIGEMQAVTVEEENIYERGCEYLS